MSRFLASCSALALVLTACGQSQEEEQQATADPSKTPYGSTAAVSTYLQQIAPHIEEIGQLHGHYETALSSAKSETTDRQGTGRNLSAKAEEVRPQLQQLLQLFDEIESPPLLASFHRDVRKLITLRLSAYDKTILGWSNEEAGSEDKVIYAQLERTIAEANQLIVSLNGEMTKINAALAAVPAASP
ncbi:MAG: hypothetical protein HOM68_25675 [Gemmatimonadetes bacterium]|nr:hypothetical protein [Gemmatimonadota bacterium]MBT4613015.1 hypothetical protein [Gemmatimonadota bacterium]MBT5059958.1 hypothetical protein [Gemmatimonadota bacterium]MBT5141969.1 hypothetical protein [Gemmatimonadota bacterium]MBT5589741.1 hypothetical protein [Gemmatimonadota bacterium]